MCLCDKAVDIFDLSNVHEWIENQVVQPPLSEPRLDKLCYEFFNLQQFKRLNSRKWQGRRFRLSDLPFQIVDYSHPLCVGVRQIILEQFARLLGA